MSITTRDLGPFPIVLRMIRWMRAQTEPWTERELADAFGLHWQAARRVLASLEAQRLVAVVADTHIEAHRRFAWREREAA